MIIRICYIFFILSSLAMAQQHEGRLPYPFDGVYEGEYHFSYEKPARVQGMSHYGKQWSRNAHLLWDGKPGERLQLSFLTRFESEYELGIRLTKAPDYGVCEVYLDGKKISTEIDTYARNVELAPIRELGKVALKKGVHQLELKLVAANSQAKPFKQEGRFLLGLDYLQLIDLDPQARNKMPEVKLAHLDYGELYKTLKTYCSDCHHGKRPEGKIDLESLTTSELFLEDLTVANKVMGVLQAGEMPPEGAEQPSLEQKTKLTLGLQNYIDQRLASTQSLEPLVMRRMNRLEYNNSVVELLDLKGDIYPLPEKVIRSDF